MLTPNCVSPVANTTAITRIVRRTISMVTVHVTSLGTASGVNIDEKP
ncbi:MAG: hypothetical protein U0V45_05130 [Flavobacteriales bacterium]